MPPEEDVGNINVDGVLARSGRRRAVTGASFVVYEGLVDPASLEVQSRNEALALALDLHLGSNHIVCRSSQTSTISLSI